MSGAAGGGHRIARLVMALALTVAIGAGCGRVGDGAGSVAVDPDTAGADPATGLTGPETSDGAGAPAATTLASGPTSAGIGAPGSMAQDEVADLERALDEIDQVLADLEAELAQD